MAAQFPLHLTLGTPYIISGSVACPNESDKAFGPFSDCRYDFTLFFEQAVLIWYLYGQAEKTSKNRMGAVKLVLTTTLVGLQLALVVFWALCGSLRAVASVPSAALNLFVAVLIVPLSYFEHTRSVKPSSILNSYLLFSAMLDLAQARTLFVLNDNLSIVALFTAALGLKMVLLTVEEMGKRPYLEPRYASLSPESTSGIINRSFLWWLNGLFNQGSRGLILLHRLYALDSELAAEPLGDVLLKAWNRRSRPEGRFALVFAMWHSLRGPFSHVIFPRICLIGFTYAQPFLISRVLSLLTEEDDDKSRMTGFYLIIATALIYIGIAISSLHSSHNLFRFITMFRGATVSLIYNRTLSLEDGVYDEAAAVSLMSTDVDRIAFCLEELNECWSRLIEIALGIPLLARQLGWVSIMPFVIVIFSTVGTSFVTKFIGDKQKTWADATQRRIGITSSLLSEMKSVKMMGLSGVLGNIIQDERVKETKKRESYAWVIVWMNVVANLPMVMAPAATFAVYAIQAILRGSDSLNTTQAFTSLALITLVAHPASRLLCAVPNTVASIGCFDRIQQFLLAKSQVEDREILQNKIPHSRKNIMIRVQDADFRPSGEADVILSDADITIHQGSIVMVAGIVGSGKSTLLRAILGELPCDRGSVMVGTQRMGYSSQKPWLPNGTVREVICGFLEDQFVDEKWYNSVLESCALNHDITNLGTGDRTVIGSRGITLSGGQKQRVALARAIFSRSQVFILDDVLSALDTSTQNFVVNKLLGSEGLFRRLGSTVVLSTHAVQYLSLADQIIVLSGANKPVQVGTYDEITRTGAISHIPPYKVADHHAEEPLFTGNLESKLSQVASVDEARDLKRQTGDTAVYKYYFKSVGLVKMLVFVFFVIVNVFSSSFSQIWLKWWADIDGGQIGLYVSIYLLLGITYSIGNGGYAWAISVVIGPSTGRKLHKVLLQTVMRAPQSFFAKTDTGMILNRFSQDMSLIEGQLAVGVLATVSNLFSSLVEAALVAVGSSYMAITIPFFMLAIYFLQRVYLRTSRQLRILDLESRSPVYAHFLETLEGLATIRAFAWQTQFTRVNSKRLDDSQKPYYLMFCIQRWLALVLDLMVATMAVIVIALATSLRNSTNPGLLGISMNNILSFNVSLSAFVAGWTLLETSLGAIARLQKFEADTEVEAKEIENIEPPDDWPSSGLIEIKDVSACYNPPALALKNVTMKILPGQKVGICGRTGSGKSSLLATIVRILDLSTGSIRIDSLDLSTIPRETIRSRLTTMPQDPLHITGTVRFNADPFGKNTDDQIIDALTKVRVWSVIFQRGGLEAELYPDSLSKGQQQLLALARGMLQKSTILLLDEATGSVDLETDQILQKVIREEFKNFTVVTVAHRPETILDSDVIAVMDSGSLVEFGKPDELMAREGSALKSLWGTTDSAVLDSEESC